MVYLLLKSTVCFRFERRSFGRDFESRDRDKERSRERNRYNDRRRTFSDNREEEPEWFSGKLILCIIVCRILLGKKLFLKASIVT